MFVRPCFIACALAAASAASAQPAAPPSGSSVAYVIRPGDTLIHIAQRHLTDGRRWTDVRRLNRVRDDRRLVPGSTLLLPIDWLRHAPGQATVVDVTGNVESGGRRLAAGNTLTEGASIASGTGASTTLSLSDGSTVAVPPDTRITLERLRTHETVGTTDSVLRVEAGRVENRVPPGRKPGTRFEIRTPTAAAAVRGTRFRVASVDAGTVAEVLEGETAVSGRAPAGAETPVRAGFGIRVDSDGRVGAPAALLPAPATTQLPELLERVVSQLRFAPVEGAVAYRAQVSTDAGFRTTLSDAVIREPVVRIVDLPDGSFALRVRAIDRASIEGQDAVHPFRIRARPEPPFPSLPVPGGRIRSPVIEFAWAEVGDAATYTLQVARGGDFSTIAHEASGIRGPRHRPDAAFEPASYVWRVASVRANGDRGPWGDPQSFEVKPAPANPEPPTLEENKLSFRWPSEPGQRFLFQFARDPAFAQEVHELKTDSPEAVLPRPAPGTYFMRVQATDPDGFVGPFTASQRIDVPAPPPPPPPRWPLLLLLLPFLL